MPSEEVAQEVRTEIEIEIDLDSIAVDWHRRTGEWPTLEQVMDRAEERAASEGSRWCEWLQEEGARDLVARGAKVEDESVEVTPISQDEGTHGHWELWSFSPDVPHLSGHREGGGREEEDEHEDND